jgi:nitrate reductase gamma subunit
MKKTIGTILIIGGIISLIITTINFINESESFNFLGLEVTVSQGSFMPMIISGIVLIAGLILLASSKGR